MGKADSYNPSELQTVKNNIQHKKKDLKRNDDLDLTNILSQINAEKHSKSNQSDG